MGYYTGLQLKELGYSRFDKRLCFKAIQEVLNRKGHIGSLREADSIINMYFKKALDAQNEKTMKEGQEFLARNKMRKGVITTPSGVQYEMIRQGSGIKPTVNDSIIVLYKASTIDDKVFIDKSHSPEKILFTGNTPGLKEVLQMMPAGSKYKIYLPYQLAYGKLTVPGGIHKPYMTVVYDMELITVIPQKSKAKI
jgi:FKBP-type peptidyl-prolyl cis-trans isomerase FklB